MECGNAVLVDARPPDSCCPAEHPVTVWQEALEGAGTVRLDDIDWDSGADDLADALDRERGVACARPTSQTYHWIHSI
jgi:hypothetical protein